MSRLVTYNMEQGSEEWLQARCGVPTASTISAMLTPTGKIADNQTSRIMIAELASERLTGRPAEPIWSRDIERGHLDEPIARDIYAEHAGVKVEEVGFMVTGYIPRGKAYTDIANDLGYSPDGLIGEHGLIEIKSRKPKLHLQYVLTGQIPFAHMVQMQTGMLVSERVWCDYISYCGGLPMHIQRVYADFQMSENILEAASHLEREVEQTMIKFKELTREMPETEYIDHFGDDLEISL